MVPVVSTESMQRVSKCRPCPICGKPDWCLLASDGSAAICARISEGSQKRCGDAGWLHVLRDDPDWQERPRVRRLSIGTANGERTDLGPLMAEYVAAVDLGGLGDFADSLGLSVASLNRLRVGWAEQYHAWAFPMVDADVRIRGIRLRALDGHKWSVRGGRDGVFWPAGLTFREPLLLPEGPTDTFALLDLGFEAIGRPSCLGGVRILCELVRRRKPPGVIVVSDRDENGAGQQGAESMATALLTYCPSVRVIQPPKGIKDVRTWLLAGATRENVQAVINAALPRKLTVRRKRGRNHGG